MQRKTRIINIFGGPGSGKSTTALGVTNLMKKSGWSVEFAEEYAKQMTWEGRQKEMGNQIYIFAKQHKKLERLMGKVDWIVTDCPILLGAVYAPPEYYKNFLPLILEAFDSNSNFNYVLTRDFPYNQEGRNQNEQEAKEIDSKINQFLIKYSVPHAVIPAFKADETIMSELSVIGPILL